MKQNTDQKVFANNWESVKEQARAKWEKLTDDDIASVQGKKELLLGRLSKRYGLSAEQAHRELAAFMKECDCSSSGLSKSKGETRAAAR